MEYLCILVALVWLVSSCGFKHVAELHFTRQFAKHVLVAVVLLSYEA